MRQVLLPMLLAFAACGAERAVETPVPNEDTNVELFEDVLAQHQALNRRVEEVAHRILVANADWCPETVQTVGLSAHTLKDYPEDIRPLARALLGVDEGMSVRSVVADGPASRAGVEAGDAIRKVGTMPIERSVVAERIWSIAQGREMQEPSVAMELLRDGNRVAVEMETVETCDAEVALIFSEAINAHTDGETLYITTELVRRTESDARLALILAHELGHVILHGGEVELGPTIELEADAAGLALIARAGYDLDAAVSEMDRFGQTLTRGFSGTHPLHTERVRRLRELQAELETGAEPRLPENQAN